MKKKWLENANKRIDEKETDNKRKMAAIKALTTGSKWQWNPAANAKGRRHGPMARNVPYAHKQGHNMVGTTYKLRSAPDF